MSYRAEPRSPEERFWEKVEPELTTGCMLWAASVNRKGYGQFMVKKGLRPEGAHRFAWICEHGPIPQAPDGKSLCVLHKCDTPACVNVGHLFLGTRAENNADMARKGRHGYRKFAKLTEAQAREARDLIAQGWLRREVAALFGVCRETIGHLARGQTWRNA